ncbi:hypothetical protein [Endozoicomonas sp. GU-1]|uniref:hypothetical protein n=1 Tax=Endozoicomonas sp. GU-1 TaxID=3009078 RepID=UPI0022B41404|nr:hypothetical protein [Endozoicomonas sp. GU-1]WBA82406.1 hypothetical protein O2T12_04445 [Endozoicomonas sp. GU-1]WBA85339.1 hypothetical protein O3276_19120 [Endozoicomonas sp. GU-1]
MDRYKKPVLRFIVMAGLAAALASPVMAEEVMVRDNMLSVSENYDSVGIDNAGSININGNMNVNGPFTNRAGGSVNVAMGLNISGSTLTATNEGTLTAGSYWSDGHFINNTGAVASLGVINSSGNVTNKGTLSFEQGSVVADFDGSGGTTYITITKLNFFQNQYNKPLIKATGRIRLDSDSKIVLNVAEGAMPDSVDRVAIALSGKYLKFNHDSTASELDRAGRHLITSGNDSLVVEHVEMDIFGISADLKVKKKK